jgi:UDP-N-acetylmuramyl tripeptide synthase
VAARVVGHGGTSIPGLVATAVAPDTVAVRATALRPVVLVVGTNGKTTTSRLVSRIVEAEIGRPVTNASGANLYQSIASTVVLSSTDPDGGGTPAVFEVDELALPAVDRDVTPAVIVATNLFRDQLDRYGEVQVIVDRWRTTLAAVAPETTFVFCADDARLAMLAGGLHGRTLSFGLDWTGGGPSPTDLVATAPDPVSCVVCGRPLEMAAHSIGHLGRFSCADGHVGWRPPDVAFHSEPVDGGSQVELRAGGQSASFVFELTGVSFAYDAAAAATAALALGIPLDASAAALERATAAFGRSESVTIGGRHVVLALAKNPASLAEATALAARLEPTSVLFALNDAPADGRDVSWIWDVDLGPLLRAPTIVLTGARGPDLALRVKYGADDGETSARSIDVAPRLEDALARAVAAAAPGDDVLVVATYTALLALRARLVEEGLLDAAPT